MAKIDLDLLVSIASEVEQGDPIDWGKLKVGQIEAFKMIGTSVLEMFDKETYTDADKIILLATITKLTVENMLLHTKLLTQNEKDV